MHGLSVALDELPDADQPPPDTHGRGFFGLPPFFPLAALLAAFLALLIAPRATAAGFLVGMCAALRLSFAGLDMAP